MAYKRTVLKQIIAIYTVLSFLLTLALVIFFINYFYKYQISQTHKLMMTLWKSMDSDFQKAIDYPFNDIYIRQTTKSLGDNLNNRIIVTNFKKEILFDYIPQKVVTYYQQNNYPITKAELYTAQTLADTISMTKTGFEHISVFPVKAEDRFLGYVICTEPLKLIYDPWYNFIIQIIQICAVLFIIAFVIFLILSQNIVYPLKVLSQFTKRIAHGDLDLPHVRVSNNEIGELGLQMVEMAHKLKESFILNSKQNETLETMLDSIHQALWIVDTNSKIVMANFNFKTLVENNAPEGSYLWEVIRHPRINNLVKQILETGENYTLEIDIEEKIYLCSTSLISSSRQIIFSLLDISGIKEIEKLKKDFVSNVSHELKTPLTTIKGFIETMMQDANEEQQHYLKVIDRNTDRLVNIVRDLLFLSKLEQAQYIEEELFNITDVIKTVTGILKPNLNEKNMSIVTELKTEKTFIKGDMFKIEQVFVNLIDNAVKYAGKGEIRITLSHQDKNLVIRLADQGDGIPRQHLSRLFERFYVVDSSRSKRMGGTGLGLAIVKHIIHLHNGRIQVQSEEGIGTTFTIYLPFSD